MRSQVTRYLSAWLLALAASACATSGGSTGEPRQDRNLLTAEDLQPMATFTAWEAVQRMRPMWLRPGGVRNSANPGGHHAHVFVDEAPYGPLEALRSFRVSDIRQMRFVNATDATTRYGGQYQGGVIIVTSRGNR